MLTSPEPTPDFAQRRELQRIIAAFKKVPLALEDYHAVGEQMRRLSGDPSVARRGSNWRRQVAEAVGVSESTLNKALQFRERYAEEELPELRRLGVGWSRLTIALAVKQKAQRHQLLRRARDGGWSDTMLQREIQRRRGSRRGGGRPRKRLSGMGLQPDLSELARLTGLWLEFTQGVWAQSRKRYAAEARAAEGPAAETLRGLLAEAEDWLRSLHTESRDALATVRELRKRLPEE